MSKYKQVILEKEKYEELERQIWELEKENRELLDGANVIYEPKLIILRHSQFDYLCQMGSSRLSTVDYRIEHITDRVESSFDGTLDKLVDKLNSIIEKEKEELNTTRKSLQDREERIEKERDNMRIKEKETKKGFEYGLFTGIILTGVAAWLIV